MKNYNNLLLKALLLLSLFSNYSCRKDVISENSPSLLGGAELPINTTLLANWIDGHEVGLSSAKAENIKLIKSNLDYSSLKVGKRKNGDDLIVIPIKGNINAKLKLGDDYLLNLLVVKHKNGKMRWSTIIAYLPADGIKKQKSLDETIVNILNNEVVKENGKFRFFNLQGELLYQLQYKDGKLSSYAHPIAKGNTKSNKNLRTASTCTDWYFVSTYYFADGSTQVVEEYLYTTCDEGGGGGGTGPGEEGPDPEGFPEEDNDQEISVAVSDVFFAPNYAGSNDGDGTSLATGSSMAQPVIYHYRGNILYKATSRAVLSVYMEPLSVTPVSDYYEDLNYGPIQKYLSLQELGVTHTPNASSVTMNWYGKVNYRWSYINLGTAVVHQYSGYYSKNVSLQ